MKLASFLMKPMKIFRFRFTKFSNKDFKTVLHPHFNQQRIDHFSLHSPIATSSYGPSSSEPNIAKINHIFSVILMIFTTPLQLPWNRLYIVMSVYASTVMKIMVSIMTRSLMTKPAFHRKRMKLRVVIQVMTAEIDGLLIVTKTTKAVWTMNTTSLELLILSILLTIAFTVLMG